MFPHSPLLEQKYLLCAIPPCILGFCDLLFDFTEVITEFTLNLRRGFGLWHLNTVGAMWHLLGTDWTHFTWWDAYETLGTRDRVLEFGCRMSPKGMCVEGWVPRVAFLRCRVCWRSLGPWGSDFRRDWGDRVSSFSPLLPGSEVSRLFYCMFPTIAIQHPFKGPRQWVYLQNYETFI